MDIDLLVLQDSHTNNMQAGDVFVRADDTVCIRTATDPDPETDSRQAVNLATGALLDLSGEVVRLVHDAKLTGTA